MAGWLNGLQKTAAALSSPLQQWLTQGSTVLTEDRLEALETILLKADIGLPTTTAILEELQAQQARLSTSEALLAAVETSIKQRLLPPGRTAVSCAMATPSPSGSPMLIVMVVGVNGAGKTTLIGKLAHRYTQAGHTVMIGAADTFRAAADEQLAVWADRAKATIVRLEPGSDPAAVVYQTLTQAKAQEADVVILDTAGRLQNQSNLMEQLAKLRRILDRERPTDSVVESLLVLEAATGQNGLQQAKLFEQTVGLTGVALTKLDGSAKGGVLLAITQEYGLPVKLVGLGEGIDDLADFDPALFAQGLLGHLVLHPLAC
jgi:fused signal recognition particle receptor